MFRNLIFLVIKTDLLYKSGICVSGVVRWNLNDLFFKLILNFHCHRFSDIGGLASQTLFIIHYFGSNSCDLLTLAIIAFQTQRRRKNVWKKCSSCERSIYFYYCRLEAEFRGIDTSRKHTLMNLRTEQHVFKVTLMFFA